MERHSAIEKQPESRSGQEHCSPLDAGAGFPIPERVDPSDPTHVYTSAPSIEHWPALLEELEVRFLVLDINHDAELFELFQAHSGWVIDSQDDQSVLLAPIDVGSSAMASRGER